MTNGARRFLRVALGVAYGPAAALFSWPDRTLERLIHYLAKLDVDRIMGKK